MKVIKDKRGFTLVELVIVIIIIAILAAVAIPRFADLADHAREASERATATAVRQAITIYRADHELRGRPTVFPPALDGVIGVGLHTGTVTASPGTLATEGAPFFTAVMETGGAVTSGWVKLAPITIAGTIYQSTYRGPDRRVFGYVPADGSFRFMLRAAP